MTILRVLAGPVFIIGVCILAVSMAVEPLNPPYGVWDALRAGWSW